MVKVMIFFRYVMVYRVSESDWCHDNLKTTTRQPNVSEPGVTGEPTPYGTLQPTLTKKGSATTP